MRIAVVGTGVSGLVAAHLLRDRADLTVFEARERVGGHVATVEVEGPVRSVGVDTGFIVYNEENYPLFTRLLDELGVETQPSDMSFSVRCDRTGLEYNGTSLGKLFSRRRNLLDAGFYRMLLDILRFNREAALALENGAASQTLGEYVREAGYSRRLAEHYLVPMGSALWSVPRSQVLRMPAEFFVRFFENHGMLSVDDRPEWRVVSGGSRRYLEALVRPLQGSIRVSTPVTSVRRSDRGVEVNGEAFDQVILACHADEALALLDDPTDAERDVLGALPYQANDVVLHTDTSVMPRRRRAWGSWNYWLTGSPDEPARVTYLMNLLQTLPGPVSYCVTLNATEAIDPEAILYRARYDHPVYSRAGFAAQGRFDEISGPRHRTHYCGAYWGYGFHEDGVRSAVRVAGSMGVDVVAALGPAASEAHAPRLADSAPVPGRGPVRPSAPAPVLPAPGGPRP